MNNTTPVIYTISQLGSGMVRLFTKDARIATGDKDITVTAKNLVNMMTITAKLLNDEGLAVLFEVD